MAPGTLYFSLYPKRSKKLQNFTSITMNSLPILWENKVKYLGLYFSGITGKVDVTSTLR